MFSTCEVAVSEKAGVLVATGLTKAVSVSTGTVNGVEVVDSGMTVAMDEQAASRLPVMKVNKNLCRSFDVPIEKIIPAVKLG